MKSLFLIFLVAVSAPALADEPFTFKHITLGAVPPPGELESSLGINFTTALLPCKRTPGVQYTCTGSVSVLNHMTETMVTIGADGTVQAISVTFQHVFFEDLEAGAITKYGQPTSSGTQPMQNAYGMRVTYIEHDWKRSNGDQASICNYLVNDITRGQFTMETAASAAATRKLLGID